VYMQKRLAAILTELTHHAPFTLFGALTGIVCMLVFRNLEQQTSYRLFYIFHPTHVVLSAMITASLFRLHERMKSFLVVLIIGYTGCIGTATLSDSIIPFLGESILGVGTVGRLHFFAAPGELFAGAQGDVAQEYDLRHRAGVIEAAVWLMPVLCPAFSTSSPWQHSGHSGRISGRRFGRVLRVHPQKPFKLLNTLFQFDNLVFQLLYICVLVHIIVIGQR